MSNDYTYYPDILCKEIGSDKATICSKVWFFCGSKNIPSSIRLSWLTELLHYKKDKKDRKVKELIKELVQSGMIEYEPRHGKGLAPLFKRGQNLYPFYEQKGAKFVPKRGQNLYPKKYNKNINNNNLLINNIYNSMDGFKQFWQAFFFGSYAKYEQVQLAYKEKAQSIWNLMPESARNSCLNELRKGKRAMKTEYVVYYLQHYMEPLPIWFNGDTDLQPDEVGKMAVVRYKNQIAYCYPQDLERVLNAGAILVNSHD